jgi:hypothetical protein
MKPPIDYAAWLYRGQMVAITAVMLWDHHRHIEFLNGTAWPAALYPRVIDATVSADWARMACIGLVVMGLVSRNLVRQFQLYGPGGLRANVGGDRETDV